MSIAIDAKYVCFEVKEKRDDVGKVLALPMRQATVYMRTLKDLRAILYIKCGMKKDSRIFYIDNEGDKIPIDSDCEYLEAFMMATTFTIDKKVPLLVNFTKHSKEHSVTNNVLNIEGRIKTSKEQDIHTQNVEKMKSSCPIDLDNMTYTIKDVVEKTIPISMICSENSNVSMESCLDTSPPTWFIDCMESIKKDLASVITNGVVQEVTKILDEHMKSLYPNDRPSQSLRQSKRHSRSTSCSLHSKDKDKRKTNIQDEEQSSDASIERVDEPQDTDIIEDIKQLQQERINVQLELIRIDDQIRVLSIEKNRRISKRNIDNARQSGQNYNAPERLICPIPLARSSLHVVHNPYGPRISSESVKIPDGEFRMNCSITGNQMLDMGGSEGSWSNTSLDGDIDKISLCSGYFMSSGPVNQEQEDAFVMIDMPNPEDLGDQSFMQADMSVAANAEQRQHDNDRDSSPSFELLSEASLPPSPLCVDESDFLNGIALIDEDTQLPEETNLATNLPYVVDIHGKIYNKDSTDFDELTNIENADKRYDDVWTFATGTLPTQEICFPKSSQTECQTSNERKNSQDRTKHSNDDAKDSPTSNMSAENDQARESQKSSFSRTHSQSQTDSSDLTQSFHSHTTSVTDNGAIFTESYASLTAEQTLCDHGKTVIENSQRMTPVTATATTAITTTTSPKDAAQNVSNYIIDHRFVTGCYTEECLQPFQSNRGNDNDGSTNGPRKTSGEHAVLDIGNPVHILPESLVTVAAHVGSVAYVTAQDVFTKLNKLRSHTKEVPVKRLRVKKNMPAENSSASATYRSTDKS